MQQQVSQLQALQKSCLNQLFRKSDILQEIINEKIDKIVDSWPVVMSLTCQTMRTSVSGCLIGVASGLIFLIINKTISKSKSKTGKVV